MEFSDIFTARNLKIATGALAACTVISLAVDMLGSDDDLSDEDLDDLTKANNPVDAFETTNA